MCYSSKTTQILNWIWGKKGFFFSTKIYALDSHIKYVQSTLEKLWYQSYSSWQYTVGQKLKKSPGKKLVKSNITKKIREIAFLVVLNYFPVQKLIFGHFWNCEKWNLVKKNLFVKLIYLIRQVFLPGLF